MPADSTGRLRLDLFNPYGDPLDERVDVFLQHQTFSEKLVVRNQQTSRPFTITKLRTVPEGLYRLSIDPPSYLPVSVFVNIPASGEAERSLAFPIDHAKILRVEFPKFADIEWAQDLLVRSNHVEGFEGAHGETLYRALDDTSRAGLLNILAKSRRTPLVGGGVVLDGLGELRRIRGDRFFASVTKQLREQVKNSVLEGLFRPVDGSLHQPPEGFTSADSFKTHDRYGNLQMTFFHSGDSWVADLDIDDAAGLEHVFQVTRNALTGRPTHPYDIHQILLRHQEIDSGYRLILHEDEGAGRNRKRAAAGQKA